MKFTIQRCMPAGITSSIVLLGVIASTPVNASALNGLVAHRAVYEVELADSTDRSGISSMNGRIVYEITGSVCEGFAVTFRFVTRIDTGKKSFVTDQRTTTYEGGAGKNFRFLTKTYVNEQFEKEVSGKALRTEKGTDVSILKPDSRKLQLGNAIFMTDHLAKVIEKALLGENFFTADVYDGSDNGDELMATTTIIGKKKTFKPEENTPGFKALNDLANWPVSISYFSMENEKRGESLPIYQVSFDLFESGISGDLKMHYKDYTLKGKLSSVKLLPVSKCE